MPNWCEGNIRLHGKSAAIMGFLRNEIECVGYRKFPDGLESKPVEIADFYGEISVKKPESMKGTAFCSFHIKGTRRNFIDEEFEIYLHDDEEKINTVCIDNAKAAWGFDATPYLDKARKYGIDIRIVGFERGLQFAQDIEIIGGEIVKDREVKYADWTWECPMPNMGG